ncbi:LacI family DNA-binding transcriptional regulator [Paramicrobacterium fandaimingii]|uniref:LacI family DNA-binding transcriptional regulator n=1 Tax=Paramicrobacterium fandaimingii TaxID=2708079 RepID=UPI001420B8E7|nr:LacI family DNA-binding transcriptional regulator [Microbacterium fandaimingii]
MAQARPTLQTVARAAGTSVATVSKVLNDRPGVSAETRERVIEALASSKYERSTDDATARRQYIVCSAENFATPYSSTILSGMVNAASGFHIDLVVRSLNDAARVSDAESASSWVRQISGALGVVVLTTSLSAELVHAIRRAQVPIVTIDPIGTSDSNFVSISATNWMGGRTATDHLIELGHRRIAWLGGVRDSAPSVERRLGFVSAMQQADLSIDDRYVSADDFSFESGLERARSLLALPTRPTGFVCANDDIALGVVQAAREKSLDIPRQVSIIGFDDVPQARQLSPKLTTVHQPLTGMGAMAVETLLSLSRGGSPASSQIQLATSLVIRDTTGKPGS